MTQHKVYDNGLLKLAATINKATLSWKVPFISAAGLCNGYKLKGYQLHVDDSLHSLVKGC